MSAMCSAASSWWRRSSPFRASAGTLIVAVQNRDLPMIQAGALVMAATYCAMNFLADLTYAVLDKRIQYG